MNDLFHGFEFIHVYIDVILILSKVYWADHVQKLLLLIYRPQFLNDMRIVGLWPRAHQARQPGPCPRPWRGVTTDRPITATCPIRALPDPDDEGHVVGRGGGRTRTETGVGSHQEGRGQRDAMRTPTKLLSRS